VRISPFDSNARRHTSFAAVFASPQVDDSIEIDIKEVDLKIDTFRAGGAGGQHVNTTDSAVRITHMPTGIVVQCQNERSQHKNKATAMKILKSRMYERELELKQEKINKTNSVKKKIEWGSQIRSYVLQPYQMVKDHRTNYEEGNINAVLDGELDSFMIEYLMQSGGMKIEK
ncbi:MAG: peptide chain release factor-like protein, partial [Pseudomonadota bacterium]